ncbi:MAG: DUF389 domain-containing protein [Solirubrobacterales bacterium]|nr:DUF389 domain-containing protein [Solirubrobacterales bacterium]
MTDTKNSEPLGRRLLGISSDKTRTPEEIRDAVYLSHGDVAAKGSRFWLLLVLSAGIATAGVISDSTATVIGAMIIAPLATPIQGVAVAITFGEVRPLIASVTTLALAMAVVIATGFLLALVLPELVPISQNSQITGRVSPTIVDLVAAAVTGVAGSFAIARRDIGDILPGVAIAISLVPPLAVVGVTAQGHDWDGALGALVLFATNMLAIIVVGVIVFSGVQLIRGGRPQPAISSAFVTVIVASVIVTAALGVATYRTVQEANEISAATDVGRTWAKENGEKLVKVAYEGNDLVFLVEGSADGSKDRELSTMLEGSIPDGTSLVINRVPGERKQLPSVGS